jgi:hypothetical protein
MYVIKGEAIGLPRSYGEKLCCRNHELVINRQHKDITRE